MNDLALGRSNLQDALLTVSKNYVENMELAPAEAVRYSPRLERKMARLLKSTRKPYRKLIDAPYKKALAACLALIIFAGAFMSCKPIRDPVVEFFTDVYEKFAEFFFDVEDKATAPQVIEEIRLPTYIPDGYVLSESPIPTGEDTHLCTVWRAEDGSEIVFRQKVLAIKTTYDTENAEFRIVSDDIKFAIVKKDARAYIFWNDCEYSYSLVTEELSEDEIEKIIFSLF